MERIEQIQVFLLDMDGTVYLGNKLLKGARRFLDIAAKQGKKVIFLTNNSSKNRFSYRDKLSAMGIEVDPGDVFTSGEATALYLKRRSPKASLYVLGTPLLIEDFSRAGFRIEDEGRPDYVVLGFDTTLTYDKLWKACNFIRAGSIFVATHPDYNCPVGDNSYMPDAGSMIKCVEASTGIAPVVVGKPNLYMFESACKKYALEKDKTAIVGDRLYTDIQFGLNAGITSVLVYSGETTPGMYARSNVRATCAYPSLDEIAAVLSAKH